MLGEAKLLDGPGEARWREVRVGQACVSSMGRISLGWEAKGGLGYFRQAPWHAGVSVAC